MSEVGQAKETEKVEGVQVECAAVREESKRGKKLPWWGVILVGLVVAGGTFLGLTKLMEVVNYAPPVPPDEDPPVLTLLGDEEVEILLGQEEGYVDAGATAWDERDGELEVGVEMPEIDVWRAGEYEVKYEVADAAGNVAEAVRKVKVVAPEPVEGAIYLTFDDGPSEHTARLLDVLKRYDVKATFFVTGRGEDELIKREYEEGHAVGLHTFSHNYAYIYQNQQTFFEDLYAVQERVRRVTGYTSMLMRFPGGSSNTVSGLYDGGARIMSQLVDAVTARGFKYFDWNVSSGDAGGALSADEVFNNVTAKWGPGEWVVLQHDTQGFSVDAVERIVQFGKRNGYQFKALDMGSYGAWHYVQN